MMNDKHVKQINKVDDHCPACYIEGVKEKGKFTFNNNYAFCKIHSIETILDNYKNGKIESDLAIACIDKIYNTFDK